MTKRASILCLAAATMLAAGCVSPASQANRSLDSVHQPVVANARYTLDLGLSADALAPGEAERLAGWLRALSAGRGDLYAVTSAEPAESASASIAGIADQAGLAAADPSMAAMQAPLPPGSIRVTLLRNRAYVPGCPNWASNSYTNFGNATSAGFGCAVNSNIAAMVADPEDLVRGVKAERTTTNQTLKALTAKRDEK